MEKSNYKNYEEKIKELKDTYLDYRWSDKRNKIIKRDDYKCQNCQSMKNLEVHHTYYQNSPAWDYPDESLITLCRTCHQNLHEIRSTIRDFEGKESVNILKSITWAHTYLGVKDTLRYASSEWKEKKDKIIDRDRRRCQICGSDEFLEVHHTYYSVENEPWEYPDDSLVTLCNKCHQIADSLKKELNDVEGINHIGILLDLYWAYSYFSNQER